MRTPVLGKRGIAKDTVAKLIVGMFIIVVFLAFTDKLKLGYDDISSSEQCRHSIERNARYHIAGLNLGSEIDCPTKSLELEGNDMEEAKRKVADAMYTCWKQFHQGKLNLFDGEGTYCQVCYIIDVKTDEPISGLAEFLMTEPSPAEGMYYYDYLSNFKTSNAKRALADAVEKGINLDKLPQEALSNEEGQNKYAVLIFYVKGTANVEKFVRQVTMQSRQGKVITPLAIGIAGGFAVGAVMVVGAPVTVPAALVVGGAAAIGWGTTEVAGLLFNTDTPPEWIAVNMLREWNAETAEEIIGKDGEAGCTVLVEKERN